MRCLAAVLRAINIRDLTANYRIQEVQCAARKRLSRERKTDREREREREKERGGVRKDEREREREREREGGREGEEAAGKTKLIMAITFRKHRLESRRYQARQLG